MDTVLQKWDRYCFKGDLPIVYGVVLVGKYIHIEDRMMITYSFN